METLVTGANGFIGSHLVRELIARGHNVRCLVRKTSDLSSLDGVPATLFVGDLLDPESLVAPVKGVDYVFHVAATLLATDKERFDRVNTQGTLHLLQATWEGAPRVKRFLYVSSETAAGPADGPSPMDETAVAKPISWYGESKRRAEESVRAFADRLPVTLVRPSSVYGERERDVSQAFGLIDLRIQPRIGILQKHFVFIYVKDLVRGMIEAALSPKSVKETYFLNHPDVITSTALAKTVARAAGKPWGLLLPIPTVFFLLLAPLAELIHELTRARPKTTRDKAREIAQRYWVASPAKAKRDFGWEAETTLLEGMRRAIASHRAEQRQLSAMALEKPTILWLKYVLLGAALGTVIEVVAGIGGYYTFDPSWLSVVIVLCGFGLALGSLATLLRRASSVIQLIVPSLLVAAVEAANVAFLHAWTFVAGWPFGIRDVWARSLVLGIPGGLVVLALNAIARTLYRRRLRLG